MNEEIIGKILQMGDVSASHVVLPEAPRGWPKTRNDERLESWPKRKNASSLVGTVTVGMMDVLQVSQGSSHL